MTEKEKDKILDAFRNIAGTPSTINHYMKMFSDIKTESHEEIALNKFKEYREYIKRERDRWDMGKIFMFFPDWLEGTLEF